MSKSFSSTADTLADADPGAQDPRVRERAGELLARGWGLAEVQRC